MTVYTEKQNQLDISADEENIDLHEYWRIIHLRRHEILGLGFITFLLSVIIVFSMPPVYRSTATLLIEPQSTNVVSIEDVYGARIEKEYYKTQHQILKVRSLAEKTIATLKLSEHPEFKNNNNETKNYSEGYIKDQLINAFSEKLTVNPIRDSQLVEISFETHDSKLAALMANTMAEVYIQNDVDNRVKITTKAMHWLTGRLNGLREKLNESEQALQSYREKEQLIETGGAYKLIAQELLDLGGKLRLAEQKRREAEAVLEQITAVKISDKKLITLPEILNNPFIVDLRKNESAVLRDVSSLEERYGPMHPMMIQAKADLNEIRINLQSAIEAVISSIEEKYQAALKNEQNINQALFFAKQDLQNINRKSYRLSVLEREVESNRQLYDMFLKRFKETKEAGEFEKENARIVDRAVPGINPVKPNKKLIVFISTLLALVAGTLIAFLIEHLDRTLKSAAEFEKKTGRPLLAILPLLKLKKNQPIALDDIGKNQHSLFSESIRSIRTEILLSQTNKSHTVIMLTSSTKNEGKSLVATALALSLSEMQRVLLIDANFRDPTIATMAGLSANLSGLSECIAGSSEIENCIHAVDNSELQIMPAGTTPADPLALLASKKLEEILSSLAKSFDHIVIDSPAISAFSDALLLSKQADAVIYIAKAGATPYPIIQTGLKRLERSKVHILGGVLNATKRLPQEA